MLNALKRIFAAKVLICLSKAGEYKAVPLALYSATTEGESCRIISTVAVVVYSVHCIKNGYGSAVFKYVLVLDSMLFFELSDFF